MAHPPAPSRIDVVQSRPFEAVRCIALILMVLIIVIGLIVIIIWLAVQPKKLKYSIEHSSISGYNLTSDRKLNASFHFMLRAKNPNKRVSFYYDKIIVKVSYKGKDLSVGNVDPFYQRRRNVTDLELSMAAKDVVVYGTEAKDLKMESASGDVKLEVKIWGKIRMKVGVFKVHRTLKALCGPLAVPFSSSKGFKRVFCDVDIID